MRYSGRMSHLFYNEQSVEKICKIEIEYNCCQLDYIENEWNIWTNEAVRVEPYTSEIFIKINAKCQMFMQITWETTQFSKENSPE